MRILFAVVGLLALFVSSACGGDDALSPESIKREIDHTTNLVKAARELREKFQNYPQSSRKASLALDLAKWTGDFEELEEAEAGLVDHHDLAPSWRLQSRIQLTIRLSQCSDAYPSVFGEFLICFCDVGPPSCRGSRGS